VGSVDYLGALYPVVIGVAMGFFVVEYSIWRYKRATRKILREFLSSLYSDGDIVARRRALARFIADLLSDVSAEMARRGASKPPKLKDLLGGGDG
jgi:hypothetical protein